MASSSFKAADQNMCQSLAQSLTLPPCAKALMVYLVGHGRSSRPYQAQHSSTDRLLHSVQLKITLWLPCRDKSKHNCKLDFVFITSATLHILVQYSNVQYGVWIHKEYAVHYSTASFIIPCYSVQKVNATTSQRSRKAFALAVANPDWERPRH